MAHDESVSENAQSDKAICSFCRKSQDNVRTMVSGPNDVFICDECVVESLKVIGRSPGQLNLRVAFSVFVFVASLGHNVRRFLHLKNTARSK
jgi:hypothetical protein